MIHESTTKETRQVTDALDNPSAKIRAGQLWGSDVGQYVAFVKDETIVTGRLSEVIHYGKDKEFRDGRVKKGDVRIVVEIGPSPESHVIRGNAEVWILRSKPEVTVMGLRVSR